GRAHALRGKRDRALSDQRARLRRRREQGFASRGRPALSRSAPGVNVARSVLFLGTLVLPGHAVAHGFGARYDLPIPLSLYLTGAGLTVALSFVVMGFILRTAPLSRVAGRVGGRQWPVVLSVARVIGVAVYLLVVFAGLFGAQSPFKNIAPVFV